MVKAKNQLTSIVQSGC